MTTRPAVPVCPELLATAARRCIARWMARWPWSAAANWTISIACSATRLGHGRPARPAAAPCRWQLPRPSGRHQRPRAAAAARRGGWSAALGGVQLEDKGAAIALHCRRDAGTVRCHASRLRVRWPTDCAGYELQAGNLVMEIKPAGMDKGKAVQRAAAALAVRRAQAGLPGRRPHRRARLRRGDPRRRHSACASAIARPRGPIHLA